MYSSSVKQCLYNYLIFHSSIRRPLSEKVLNDARVDNSWHEVANWLSHWGVS